MRMIPDRIRNEASSTEKSIFDLLRASDVPGWTYGFHQLNLPVHQSKRVCEADFVLLGPRGLLVLEVKGGAVSCEDGIWTTQTLSGTRQRLAESPFEQASGAQFALEKRLSNLTDRELVHRTVFGHGVLFPDTEFSVPGIEWDSTQVIDRQEVNGAILPQALDVLGAFWEGKPGHRSMLSEEDIDRYLQALRPSFDLVPTLRSLGKRVDSELASLTRSQYQALNNLRMNSRLVFEGGAGTGKTMLAAEVARRADAHQSRVLVTCRSPIVARYLRDQKGMEHATVLPLGQARECNADSFDLVVIDEAQDVINTADLIDLDRLLVGGLRDGRWVLMLDSNNQKGLVGQFDDTAMQEIRSHRPAVGVLTDNCRNTVEIVRSTQEMTKADLGVTTVGHGMPVKKLTAPSPTIGEQVALLLEDLVEEDVPLEQVVLLSRHSLPASVFWLLPREWCDRIDPLDLHRWQRPGKGRIGFAPVTDFKGLESLHVVLEADLASSEQIARNRLYVGMSRARAGLWVVTVDENASVEESWR